MHTVILSACLFVGARTHAHRQDVTLGGLGTGHVRIGSTGSFISARLNSALTGEVPLNAGSFAAVWFRSGDTVGARLLQSTDQWGLSKCPKVEFESRYPQAFFRFPDATSPVTVRCRVLGSIVPHDVRESASPSLVLLYTVRNESRAPLDAAIALSLENILGVGETKATGRFEDRTGTTITSAKFATTGTYGLTFGCLPAPSTLPGSRLIYNARGTMALLAETASPDYVLTSTTWNALAKPPWWSQFSTEGKVTSADSVGKQGAVHPAGVVCVRAPFKPNEERTFAFSIAWHTPRHYLTTDVEVGQFYEKMFDDATAVAKSALEGRLLRAALIDEWQNRIRNSSLPLWLVQAQFSELETVFRRTILTRDSGFGTAEPGPAIFSSQIPDGDYWKAMPMLSALFPVMAKQELERVVQRVSLGNASERTVESDVTASTASELGIAPRAAVSAVWSLWQYVDMTGDQTLVNRYYPVVKRRAEDLISGTSNANDERLAVLKLAARLAELMNDRSFSQKLTEASNGVSTFQSTSWKTWVDALGLTSTGTVELNEKPSLEHALQLLSWGRVKEAWPIAEAVIQSSEGSESQLAWRIASVVIGTHYSAATSVLTLRPQLPNGQVSLRGPVFSPILWGWMEHSVSPNRTFVSFRMDRFLPTAAPKREANKEGDSGLPFRAVGIRVAKVLLPINTREVDIQATVGRNSLPGTLKVTSEGTVFELENPIELSAGMRLEFVMKPHAVRNR